MGNLAIINVSHNVVATRVYRLPPGRAIRLTDYYRDEGAARADLSLIQYISIGAVEIRDLDFGAHAAIPEIAAELDRKAEAEKAAAEAVRRQARLDRKTARQHHAQDVQAARLAERQAVEQRVAGDREAGMASLYERGRKDRIARAMDEQAAAVPEAAKAPEPVASPPPPPPPPAPIPEVKRVSMPEEVMPHVKPAAKAAAKPRAKSVDEYLADLDLAGLRAILDAFEVRGRKQMKARAQLLAAVRELGLTVDEIAKVLAGGT